MAGEKGLPWAAVFVNSQVTGLRKWDSTDKASSAVEVPPPGQGPSSWELVVTLPAGLSTPPEASLAQLPAPPTPTPPVSGVRATPPCHHPVGTADTPQSTAPWPTWSHLLRHHSAMPPQPELTPSAAPGPHSESIPRQPPHAVSPACSPSAGAALTGHPAQ